jgi:hypothetical protein
VVTDVGLILDASALLSYAEGREAVGHEIAETADHGLTVLVPATCLAAAYKDVNSEGWPYLDVISGMPSVVVVPLEHDHCAVLGGWARTLGLPLAHAAVETANHPIVPLMTAHRDLVTQFLPKEWPIIDIS